MIIENANMDSIICRSIDDLDLGRRTNACLKAQGIYYIGDLIEHTERELSWMPNFGDQSLSFVKRSLESIGLSLREKKIAELQLNFLMYTKLLETLEEIKAKEFENGFNVGRESGYWEGYDSGVDR